MAFIHGKGSAILVADGDLSAYFNSFDISDTTEVAETTTYGSGAKTYLPGLEDGTVSLAGLYDGAQNAVDQLLRSYLTSANDTIVSIAPEGFAAIGKAAYTLGAQQTSYEINSAVGDICQISAELQADGGIDRGTVHADLAARTASANHTSVDNLASSANGGVANLHVTAVSGTTPSAVVKIQHSADNVTFADLITFTTATAKTSERKAVTGTVNRYTRAISTITGTTPSFTYAATFARR